MRKVIYLALLLCVGCRYDNFAPLDLPPAKPWSINTSMTELGAIDKPIERDMVVEGVVIANDSTGNFFKQIILVDHTQSASLAVAIGYYDSYSQFAQDELVAVNLRGLVLRKVNGLLTAGYPPVAPDTIPSPISTFALVLRHLHLQGSRIDLPEVVRRFDELTIDDIGRSYLFIDSYMENPTGVYAGEHKVCRYDPANPDTTATLYTSPYATFALDAVPASLFDLRAVVMSYRDRLQLIIN